ncbi:MAG: type I restriction endonuclease subunit R, partial [Desulfobacterales bacterium]|nr:type I restriction endonuclease subunit R [Desulfobacterales bacterium]
MTRTPGAMEVHGAHIDALHILMAMGWRYISPGEADARRASPYEALLKEVLIRELRKRRFPDQGEERSLSTSAIENIARDLESPGLNEGLLAANERIYHRLARGVAATEFMDGKFRRPMIPIIDWENPGNNRFHVTEKMAMRVSNDGGSRRPDIVCFVNGVPLAVIEARPLDPGAPGRDRIAEGIFRHLRNQGNDEIPLMYAYAQLLFSVNGLDGRYGTTRTPARLWARWREEDFNEALFKGFKNARLTRTKRDRLFAGLEPAERDFLEESWARRREPTDQDRLLISLLKPERLLEFVRFSILYDRKMGKAAARPHQVFGVKRIVERVSRVWPGRGREGGVVWHAGGGG